MIGIHMSYPNEVLDRNLRADFEVETLPPIGTEVSVVGHKFRVDGIFLDIRGNGQSSYIVQLAVWNGGDYEPVKCDATNHHPCAVNPGMFGGQHKCGMDPHEDGDHRCRCGATYPAGRERA